MGFERRLIYAILFSVKAVAQDVANVGLRETADLDELITKSAQIVEYLCSADLPVEYGSKILCLPTVNNARLVSHLHHATKKFLPETCSAAFVHTRTWPRPAIGVPQSDAQTGLTFDILHEAYSRLVNTLCADWIPANLTKRQKKNHSSMALIKTHCLFTKLMTDYTFYRFTQQETFLNLIIGQLKLNKIASVEAVNNYRKPALRLWVKEDCMEQFYQKFKINIIGKALKRLKHSI